MANGLKLN